MIDHIILGMLYDCPSSGYQLKKAIENGVGMFYQASYGSIYPALKRLWESGCIVPVGEPAGGRNQKEYRITPRGRQRFLQWLSQPIEFKEPSRNHLLRIYFYDRLSPDLRGEYLAGYEAAHKQYLRELLSLQGELDTERNWRDHYFKLSTLYYGVAVTQATLEWCRLIREGKPLGQGGEDSHAD